MSHPELNQLTRAEELFDAGKLDEALELLNDQSQFARLNVKQKEYSQCLKGLILIYQNKSEEVIKLGEEIFREGQKLNEHLQSFDGLLLIITGLGLAEKFDEGFKLIEKAEALLKPIFHVSKNILLQREIRLSLLKAWINLNIGNMDSAEKCLELILSPENELGNSFEIVWANILMVNITFRIKGPLDLAKEYAKKALFLAEKINFKHYWVAMSYLYFGRVYLAISEFDISLKHLMKSLKLFKISKNTFWIARVLSTIGALYFYKGEYDQAIESLEESLLLHEVKSTGIIYCLDNLITVTLEKGDIESAQKYFLRLENLYHEKKNGHIKLLYQYDKALMLKTSSRLRDKVRAEELLKQVIETKTIFTETLVDACIHLCDLLLTEFHINKNTEVLDELNFYITKLLTIAEKFHDNQVYCETFLLQAKLALLNLDVKAARRFLTQAQKIAEKYGIKRLAMKISYEHDELLRQINVWENLKESEESLSERWKLAGLNKQIENMRRKRIIETPKISEEQPVSIFIITEGGLPLFSHSFIEEKSIESHLFGGFLTTIDYFIRETFSEGLDRAIFGEYTLLMKSISPFFISYIFKGDSYYAHQKIKYFVEHIQKEDDLWQNLLKSFQLNQTIHLKDFPLLESLITEVFIAKSIILREL